MTYTSQNYTRYVHQFMPIQIATLRLNRELWHRVAESGSSRVLEIGCGEGFVLDFFAKRRPELSLLGIDNDAAAIEMARKISSPLVEFQVGDGAATGLEDNSFDAVVMSQVLEHVPDPDKMLQEALRVARLAVVISVPREPYFRTMTWMFTKTGLSNDPEHLSFWSTRGLRSWLRKYAVVQKHYSCGFFQVAVARKQQ